MSRTRQTKDKVVFDERRHLYSADGRNLLAVTKVLDLAGLIPEEMKDEESADRGTAVHLATKYYDLHDMDTLRIHVQECKPEWEVEGYLDAWKRFLTDTRFTVKLIEHQMANKKLGIAGTLDRCGVLNRMETVVDLKSNKAGKVWATTGLQLAAYAHLLTSKLARLQLRRIQRVGVALRPDGRYNCITYRVQTLVSDLQDFFVLIRAARIRQRLGLA